MRYLLTITDPTGQRPDVLSNFVSTLAICDYLEAMKCGVKCEVIDDDIESAGQWKLHTAHAIYTATIDTEEADTTPEPTHYELLIIDKHHNEKLIDTVKNIEDARLWYNINTARGIMLPENLARILAKHGTCTATAKSAIGGPAASVQIRCCQPKPDKTTTTITTASGKEKPYYPNDETRDVILAFENDKRTYDLLTSHATRDTPKDFRYYVKCHVQGNAGSITWSHRRSTGWEALKARIDLDFVASHFFSLHYPAVTNDPTAAVDETTLRGITLVQGQSYVRRDGRIVKVDRFTIGGEAVAGAFHYRINGLYCRSDYSRESQFDIVAVYQPKPENKTTTDKPMDSTRTAISDTGIRLVLGYTYRSREGKTITIEREPTTAGASYADRYYLDHNRSAYTANGLYERSNYKHDDQRDLVELIVVDAIATTSTPTTKEPAPMKNLALSTITYLNGADVSQLSDESLIEQIRAGETDLANMDKIINKPKKLQAKMDKLAADIKTLVEYIDGRPAK